MNHDPEEILSFWFGGATRSSEEARRRAADVWFQPQRDFDEEIRARFSALPDLAEQGRFDGWREEPRSCLALVIVLDQLPRNLYRATARAFAYDSLARNIATVAIAHGFDGDLHPLEAIFLYLPLEHSESLTDQERSVVLFECLEARADPGFAEIFAGSADFARRHRDVILRFGRFPHRNAALERKDKRAEQSFLAAGGPGF